MSDYQSGASVLRDAALELAEYASYAEIVGGISVNKPQIREWCDKVFAANRSLPADPASGEGEDEAAYAPDPFDPTKRGSSYKSLWEAALEQGREDLKEATEARDAEIAELRAHLVETNNAFGPLLAARDAEIATLRAALEKAQSGWNSLNQSISYFSYDGSGVREALIAKRDEVYADSLRAAP